MIIPWSYSLASITGKDILFIYVLYLLIILIILNQIYIHYIFEDNKLSFFIFIFLNNIIMNIDYLEEKLNNLQNKLTKENDNLKNLSKNMNDKNIDDLILEDKIKQNYYSFLSSSEKNYEKRNDEYKKLISNYSQAYLDICDFYVGPALPKETYLDDKHNINILYFMFIIFIFEIKIILYIIYI